MQIKITRYHLTPIRMVIIKKILKSVSEDVETGTLCTAGENVKWFCYYEKLYGGSSIKNRIAI